MAVERTVTGGGGADIGSRISASTREGDAGVRPHGRRRRKKTEARRSQGDQTTSGSRVSLSTRNFSWRFTITRRLRADVARGLCDERRASRESFTIEIETCLKLFLAVLDMAGESEREAGRERERSKGREGASSFLSPYIRIYICLSLSSAF